MKKERVQTITLAILAAICSFFLNREKGCSPLVEGIGSAPEPIVRVDTFLQYVTKYGDVKWYEKRIVIHDSVFIDKPILVSGSNDDGLLIIGNDTMFEMSIYKGIAVSDDGKCTYNYLAGIDNDTLAFLNIESECVTKVPVVDVNIPLLPNFPGSQASGFKIGPKIGWLPKTNSVSYGIHGAYRGAYAAANYIPGVNSFLFEGGILFNLGSKSK